MENYFEIEICILNTGETVADGEDYGHTQLGIYYNDREADAAFAELEQMSSDDLIKEFELEIGEEYEVRLSYHEPIDENGSENSDKTVNSFTVGGAA